MVKENEYRKKIYRNSKFLMFRRLSENCSIYRVYLWSESQSWQTICAIDSAVHVFKILGKPRVPVHAQSIRTQKVFNSSVSPQSPRFARTECHAPNINIHFSLPIIFDIGDILFVLKRTFSLNDLFCLLPTESSSIISLPGYSTRYALWCRYTNYVKLFRLKVFIYFHVELTFCHTDNECNII